MAQVDLGSRQNRHQPLWDLTRMSSTVLRAMARRVRVPAPELPAAGSAGAGAMLRPETYVHAVATEDGLRLEEHLNPLTERPPIAPVLPGREGQAVARAPPDRGRTAPCTWASHRLSPSARAAKLPAGQSGMMSS